MPLWLIIRNPFTPQIVLACNMSSDYISGTTISDHDITLAIPGDVGTVRARLVNAIQTLGYKVLGEQPVYAKRGPRGAATWDCSLNVLDYATTVTISLKQTNDAAVLATFNFEIKSYMRMTKGDRQTLAREAEAIAALAMERSTLTACRMCGTQVTDESHFCRRCGAPLGLDVPELEVLRPRPNRRQHLLRLSRREHELHMRRRLLERFQQRIERRRRKHVNFVDDVDAKLRSRR